MDCEFTGLHRGTTLISIGCVADDGRTFYAECSDFDVSQVDPWVQENVLRNLTLMPKMIGKPLLPRMHVNYGHVDCEIWGSKRFVGSELAHWLSRYDNVEMWSDCLAYDWTLFNDLYGHAFKIPSNVFYIPFDLCTLFKLKGIDPDVCREEFAGMNGQRHHALWDAKVIKACYEKAIRWDKSINL